MELNNNTEKIPVNIDNNITIDNHTAILTELLRVPINIVYDCKKITFVKYITNKDTKQSHNNIAYNTFILIVF